MVLSASEYDIMTTTEEREARRQKVEEMTLQGVPREEVAEALGVTVPTIRNDLAALDLLGEPMATTMREREILSALWFKWTWDEITSEIGCSMSTISSLLLRYKPEKYFEMPTPDEIEARKIGLLMKRAPLPCPLDVDVNTTKGLDSMV